MDMGVAGTDEVQPELRYTMRFLSANTADEGEDLKNRNLVLLTGVGIPIGQ